MSPTMVDTKGKAEQEKDLGNEAYKARNFAKACAHYDKAIELDPTNMIYLTNKAAVLFEEAKYDECIKICENAVDIGRENHADFKLIAKAYARIGSAYQKLDNLKQSKVFFDKSLSEHRTPDVMKKSQEIDKLLKEQERLAYINPELAQVEKQKGNDLFKAGKYPDALKCYSEAILRNPNDAVLYSNRAACYQKLMEFRMAVADCDEALKRDPKFVKAYIRKGAALSALHESTKAAQAYQAALNIDPNSQEASDGLRQAYAAPEATSDEMRKRALKDPEVQSILGDPAMRLILEQMQDDPKALREHLKNPDIAQKIQKLMEAGIIAIR